MFKADLCFNITQRYTVKKKMKLKLIILFCYSTLLYSQSFLEKNISMISDTTFIFSIKDSVKIKAHYNIIENAIEGITTNSITIFDLKNDILQSINDTTAYLGRARHFMTPTPLFMVIDINFDGFNDFRIIDDASGGYLVPSFHYFLFNQNENRYVYSDAFSKLCCNLSINNELKEIYLEDYQTNEELWIKWTYRIVNNIPELSAIRKEYIFDEDNKQKFRTILEELIDGKMKVIMDTTMWKGM